ncbi:YbjN domain-containing protein [Erythrobacter oryzae]|uniref:YbjN domain-containing protein n=1 Tax=Erythrobacter oryzae TaxID=3019556 RepID=UPI002552B608|nr:YbjN domain-containing protein [Erythrobacter sp. COR-2]
MRWTVLAAAAALAFTTTGAQAQSIQHFTRADFERALVEAGATITTQDPKAERIDFEFDGGVVADALLLACEDNAAKTKCLGSSMLATFEAEDRTREQIIEAINTYNYKENFGRAYLDEDGTISVRMYIIADGGITRANYASQIGLWFASVSDFFGYLYGE